MEAATIFLFRYRANGSALNVPEFKLKKALIIRAFPCVVHVVSRGEALPFTMECKHRNRVTFVARHHGICLCGTRTDFQSCGPRKHKNVGHPCLRRYTATFLNSVWWCTQKCRYTRNKFFTVFHTNSFSLSINQSKRNTHGGSDLVNIC